METSILSAEAQSCAHQFSADLHVLHDFRHHLELLVGLLVSEVTHLHGEVVGFPAMFRRLAQSDHFIQSVLNLRGVCGDNCVCESQA